MTGKIYLLIDKEYVKDDDIALVSDKGKRIFVRKYDIKDFSSDDYETIKSHCEKSSKEGVRYFTFTRGRPFELIREMKDKMMNELEKRFSIATIKTTDEIFSKIEFAVNVPEIPAHEEVGSIFWDCPDDYWVTHNESEIEQLIALSDGLKREVKKND